jgi:hypothetical protein
MQPPNAEKMSRRPRSGIHALLVGVSAYPHLPGGGKEIARNSFGLGQLNSPALSAYRFYEWLVEMDKAERLPLPLASTRVLISPSQGEKDLIPPNLAVHGATLAELQDAAREWRQEAQRGRDGMTLFYFAGHGMQLNKWDSTLLLRDFGDGRGGTFSKTVTVGNIYYGMGPDDNQPEMARTQLYLIDACRLYPPGTSVPADGDHPSTVFPPALPGRDDRKAPIFYSTVSGAKAAGVDLEPTVFTQALLRCLKGAGAELSSNADWTEQWRVSSHSLAKAMGEVMADLQQRMQLRTLQECRVDGYAADIVLCRLDAAPEIEVAVYVLPDEAREHTKVVLQTENGSDCALTLVDHPLAHLRAALPPGSYRLAATIGPPSLSPYRDFPTREVEVRPPLVRREVRMFP